MRVRAFNRITLTSLKECESQLLQDIGDLCTLRLNEIASVGKESGVRLAAGRGKQGDKFGHFETSFYNLKHPVFEVSPTPFLIQFFLATLILPQNTNYEQFCRFL
jgi:hypothetical protein